MLRWIASVVVGLSIVLTAPASLAKKNVRKVQEVDFDEMSLKGTVRNPDGAYLVQKKGLRFLPLHEVKKDLDRRIRETSFYVR